MIMPLSLTLLSAAVRPERRNAALGIWGAIGGTAIAIGPLVGGAVTSGWAWQYIFWLNVPGRLVLLPLARWRLAESRGSRPTAGPGRRRPGQRRPVRRGARSGPGQRPRVDLAVGPGLVRRRLGAARRLRGLGAPRPTTRCSTSGCSPDRGFTAVNMTALLFSFGMFGAIFFLTQFLQTVQGYSPAGGRRPDPAVDGDHHGPGPVHRPAGRAVGRQAPGGHRARPPGRRSGLAGVDPRPRPPPTPTWWPRSSCAASA